MNNFALSVLVVLSIVFFGGLYLLKSNNKPEDEKIKIFSSLNLGSVYSLNRKVDARNVDYIKIIDNDVNNQRVQIQFLFKRRLASSLDQPWINYDEMRMFLYSDDLDMKFCSDSFIDESFAKK